MTSSSSSEEDQNILSEESLLNFLRTASLNSIEIPNGNNDEKKDLIGDDMDSSKD